MRRLPCLILSALLLAGCASPKHYTSWVGHSEEELFLHWGPPTDGTVELSEGRVLHTYKAYGRGLAMPCRVLALIDRGGGVSSITTSPKLKGGICYDARIFPAFPRPGQVVISKQ